MARLSKKLEKETVSYCPECSLLIGVTFSNLSHGKEFLIAKINGIYYLCDYIIIYNI